MLLCFIMNLCVPFGIPFDPKRYYKDGDCAIMLRRPRYQGLEYTDKDIADFEERLERIYGREIPRVQFVDFQGMPKLMRDGLFTRMRMEHHDDAEVLLDFDAPGTIQFQLGRARRQLSWRQFIMALGLHIEDEIESPSFARAGCWIGQHPLLASPISEEVCRWEEEWGSNSGGQFVARLAEHFRLLTAEILGGLTVIDPELPSIDMVELVRLQICAQFDDTWSRVAIGPERQPDAAVSTLAVAEDAPAADEGD
ncbi:hypothetical protein Tco_0093049 [Tanacetum coccineum]